MGINENQFREHRRVSLIRNAGSEVVNARSGSSSRLSSLTISSLSSDEDDEESEEVEEDGELEG